MPQRRLKLKQMLLRHKLKDKYIYIGIIGLCTIVLVIVISMLLHYKKEYDIAENEYTEITKQYTNIPQSNVKILDTPTNRQLEAPAGTTDNVDEAVDFYSLVKMNPDVIGWLTIPLCDINYPIVQAKDNEYYLNRTYKGTENSSGAIFIDAENSALFTDMHTIIYGHNMKNNTMFGGLKKIRQNPSIVNSSPYLYIYTPDGKIRQYRIFACRTVPADSHAYRFFTGSAYYDEFVQECLDQSRNGIENDIDFYDRLPLLTLSTCSGEDERFLVHCVLVNLF